MIGRAATLVFICLSAMALPNGPALAAEIFYMDRDAFSNEYVGPVGRWCCRANRPGGLRGAACEDRRGSESVPGAEQAHSRVWPRQCRRGDENRPAGEVPIHGGERRAVDRTLRRRLLSHLCRCSRARHGRRELARGEPPGSCRIAVGRDASAEAALLEDGIQAPVRTFLSDNQVPPDIVEEMFARPPTDIFWLTEQQENALTPKAPWFGKFLADKCGWSEGFERAVYQGQRPVDDLKELTAAGCARLNPRRARRWPKH